MPSLPQLTSVRGVDEESSSDTTSSDDSSSDSSDEDEEAEEAAAMKAADEWKPKEIAAPTAEAAPASPCAICPPKNHHHTHTHTHALLGPRRALRRLHVLDVQVGGAAE